jgi:glucose-6-phosphate 1-dehydrogenase
MDYAHELVPTIIVIFGAAGDLTWRKLVPALYSLHVDSRLPDRFAVLGVDRKEMSDDDFRQHLREGTQQFSRHGDVGGDTWNKFAENLSFVAGDMGEAQLYKTLGGKLDEIDKKWNARAIRVLYQATPPALVETLARKLEESHLPEDRKRVRVVLEKPFGHDLDSAKALNALVKSVFEESQIFRIDHYLGKETVQNILAFRFGNALFEPIWDRRYIDHVQITVAEQVGIEHRGEYYDHAGALRDMVQNHLMQILCLIAMEPPISFHADEIRSKKVEVLRSLRRIPQHNLQNFAVRGQYGEGWIKGEHYPSYRDEPGTATDSATETFAAAKFFVDNWRWQDVPFYLRTGKRLPSRVSAVFVQFRPVPHRSFPSPAASDWRPNRLAISIQPEESIRLYLQAKRPGPDMILSQVEMHFCYREAFAGTPPEAYETLLLDVMTGDATLFMRADQVEAAWSHMMPILEVWDNVVPPDFPNYPVGTWGPAAAETLVAQDGRSWLYLDPQSFSEVCQ